MLPRALCAVLSTCQTLSLVAEEHIDEPEKATAAEYTTKFIAGLKHILKQCPQLQSLNLSENNLSDLEDAQFVALGVALAQCQQLRSLNLSNNTYNQVADPDIENDESMEILIEDAIIFSSGLEAVLKHCTQLQSLNLSGNNLDHLDETGFINLGTTLAHCAQLHTLNLSNNILKEGISAGEMGDAVQRFAAGLAHILAACPRLQILNLSSNQLGSLNEDECVALGVVLGQCTQLHSLSLGDSLYPDDGLVMLYDEAKTFASNLGPFLRRCTQLQVLDLSSNCLSILEEEELGALGKALGACSQLHTLNLSSNIHDDERSMSEDGVPIRQAEAANIFVASLNRVLRHDLHLQVLDLSENHLGDLDQAGFEVLEKALGNCKRLKKLMMNNNGFEHLNDDLRNALVSTLSSSKELLCIEIMPRVPVACEVLQNICKTNHNALIDKISASSRCMQLSSDLSDAVLPQDVRMIVLKEAFDQRHAPLMFSSILEKVDKHTEKMVPSVTQRAHWKRSVENENSSETVFNKRRKFL